MKQILTGQLMTFESPCRSCFICDSSRIKSTHLNIQITSVNESRPGVSLCKSTIKAGVGAAYPCVASSQVATLFEPDHDFTTTPLTLPIKLGNATEFKKAPRHTLGKCALSRI
jgi:hypothetical protein